MVSKELAGDTVVLSPIPRDLPGRTNGEREEPSFSLGIGKKMIAFGSSQTGEGLSSADILTRLGSMTAAWAPLSFESLDSSFLPHRPHPPVVLEQEVDRVEINGSFRRYLTSGAEWES